MQEVQSNNVRPKRWPYVSSLRPAWRFAALLWLGMVAAIAIPLFISIKPSGIAVATVGVAIIVGAVLFAFVAAEAELRAEIATTNELLELLEKRRPATPEQVK